MKCFIDYCSHQKVIIYAIVEYIVDKFLKMTLLQALDDKLYFWYSTFLPESKEGYPDGVIKQYSLLLWKEKLFSWKKILLYPEMYPFQISVISTVT